MKKFSQIIVHTDQYCPDKAFEGVLNFCPDDILSFMTPPKSSWTEKTKHIYTYLRLKGSSNPKAYLVKYEVLIEIIRKHTNTIDEQK